MKILRSFLRFWLVAGQNFLVVTGSVAICLVAGHFLIGAVVGTAHLFGKSNESSLNRDLEICRHYRRAPYYYWRHEPCETATIHVLGDGTRTTVKTTGMNEALRQGAKKIFVFGGSTMWGYSDDAHTIPSLMQKYLGADYDVTNFGEDAFNSVQQLNLFLEKLAFGARPDIAIFYGGSMDTYAGLYAPGVPRSIQFEPSTKNLFQFQLRAAIIDAFKKTNYKYLLDVADRFYFRDKWNTTAAANLERKSKETLDDYAAFVRQATAIGRRYGIKTYFFWEPNLLTASKKDLSEHEKQLLAGSTPDHYSPMLIKAFQLEYHLVDGMITTKKWPGVFWLGDIFDDFKGPLYRDDSHFEAAGNDVVAKKIIRVISPSANL